MSNPCLDSQAILSSARANRQWRSMFDSVRLSGRHENATFLQYPLFHDRPSVRHTAREWIRG